MEDTPRVDTETRERPRIELEDWPVLPETTPVWHRRLLAAEEVGYFTSEDRENVGSWNSCAIGERFYASEFQETRKDNGTVLTGYVHHRSAEHYRLGMEFMKHVQHNHVAQARRVYEEIQRLPR